jgi:hypothetical protein
MIWRNLIVMMIACGGNSSDHSHRSLFVLDPHHHAATITLNP